MNKKALHTLEYDKIIEILAQEATCEAGAKLCRELLPVTDLGELEKRESSTDAAFTRIIKFGSLGFGGIVDLKSSLMRLSVGSVLDIPELLSVASMLEITKRAVEYGASAEIQDALTPLFTELKPNEKLLTEIRRCIIDEETIADDASVALKDIRRAMVSTNNRIKSALGTMLNNTTIRGYLMEPVITVRDGRYCLPVRADSKSRVPGMVHDQSTSGSTFFIEPMSVVDLNNELRELQVREKEEINRIIAMLSNQVAEVSDELKYDFELLVELDFNFAKGKLAAKWHASRPVFNKEGIIKLKGARHPLLDPAKVVPIDIVLGEEYSQLLVTGPNTGGKTVSLKTCGLMTLMAQAGLFIPCKDQSQIAIFEDVFADIGDEQSIEQSLSTFSSHMTNIVRILNDIERISARAGEEIAAGKNRDVPQFLTLFDELCAGTDPKEGAALAQAILTHLNNLGVRTMCTTHYAELKVYALSTSGVENASCEFSLETLSPTYRLHIGIPGKSNAFAISGKLGLSDDIIAVAQTNLTSSDLSFEDMIADLEDKRVKTDKALLEAKKALAEAESKKKEYTERNERLMGQREKVLREANEKAAHIIEHAKEVADSAIRDFNKYSAGNPDIQKMEKKRQNLGHELSGVRDRASAKKDKPSVNENIPKDLHRGDRVRVLSMGVEGTVCEVPDAKGNLLVQMGIIKSTVNIKDTILIGEENPYAVKKGETKKTAGYGGFNKAATISPEINLLGSTVDEAIGKLDKYLDDAYISHLQSVRVVHGKGTGALRSGVQQYLKRHPAVKSYHLAEFGEGDAGVTIVEFKD